MKEWLQTDFAFRDGLELHYSYTEPRIIAEKYIENSGGEVNDYKVFCFDGKAKYVMFLSQRSTALKMAVYDTDWNLMPFVYAVERLNREVPKPDNLEELLSLAEKLAEGFPFVRVDFYLLNSGEIKFGELTFTSDSGQNPWRPAEYDRKLGDLIHLPCDERNV